MRVNKEMGITHSEFFRTLPAALEGYRYTVLDNLVRIALNGGEVQLELAAQTVRRLGSFRLPVTPVEVRFTDVPEPLAADFLDQFDLHFRRGGG